MSEQGCAVTRVRLHRFRNYDETTVQLGPSLNVITGQNAQGKTNLLEAVATLALTRSPRTSTASDLLQWGSEGCQIEADVRRPAGLVTLAARFERGSDDSAVRRRTTVDGKQRGARSVLGLCPVVLFWPEDLQLVKGGPDGRRRLLDVLLSQLDTAAAAHLLSYRHVLDQRNALLHRLRAEGGDRSTLHGFTRELVHHGARVVVARRELIAALAPEAATALAELSAGREQLQLRYVESHTLDEDRSQEAAPDTAGVELQLLHALEARAGEEIARGVTVAGPHRDDVDICLDGRPARHTASQGQQRSIVLACKIAEMRHVTHATGMTPVVLLDDVVSELDHMRRGHLLDTLASSAAQQVLVTTTEPLPDTNAFSSVRHFTVRAGSVSGDDA